MSPRSFVEVAQLSYWKDGAADCHHGLEKPGRCHSHASLAGGETQAVACQHSALELNCMVHLGLVMQVDVTQGTTT